MDASERCEGSYQLAKDVQNLSHLGPKYFNKFSGKCVACHGTVKVSKSRATAHKPR